MECIYCGQSTQVTNSRHQRRSNNIWRRRVCTQCKAIFTTSEAADMDINFRVDTDSKNGTIKPFSRDTLFLSVYESCRHRPDAIRDASALTKTIISKLTQSGKALLPHHLITATTLDVLDHFDTTAAAVYRAYHPNK